MEALSEYEKNLVRHSFTYIAPQNEDIAELFYARLFDLDPEVERLFVSDMDLQRAKLMQMLASLVNALDTPDTLGQATRELGQRHAGYGVHNRHYATVGEALIWAMREVCPTIMTTPVTRAWQKTYDMLAGLAISGAR
ncbi:MAG: hemin receptor [Chloroflexi bacterium]|nr:hemin receptor [Chloroflexota bacterium]